MSMEETIIERWSGRLLRALMFYLFLVGAFLLLVIPVGIAMGAVELSGRTLGMSFWIALMLVPYIVIKARDRYPSLQGLR